VDRISEAKLASRQKAKFDDRFIIDVLGKIAFGRAR
jgi:hypothetical protein